MILAMHIHLLITVVKERDATTDNVNKKVTVKNCMPFTSYISRIINTKVDDA